MAIPEDRIPLKARQFRDRAIAYVAKHGTEYAVIKKDTPEAEAWTAYFRWLDYDPWAMRALKSGRIESMTVPTQWPEWFDLDFAKSKPLLAAE